MVIRSDVDTLSQAYQNYLQRKLDHYNKWLSDHKNFSKLYPGYYEKEYEMEVFDNIVNHLTGTPEVPDHLKATADQATPVDVPSRLVKGKKSVKRDSVPRADSKFNQAIQLFEANAGDRKTTIEAFMSQLSMTPSGATTYYYSCKKRATSV